MTYYTDSGEFHFEFGLDSCGSSFTGSGGVPGTDGQGNCFFEYDSYSSFGEKGGHWDINWEGVATGCYPTATGCTGAPTNNLELAAHFGGPLGISGLTGAGNLIFVYDSAANAWMISGAGTGIENMLDSSAMPDAYSMSYTPNVLTPPTPPSTQTTISTGITGAGGLVGTFTVAAGEVGIIGIKCVTSNCYQDAFSVVDASGAISSWGPSRHSSGGGPANNPVPTTGPGVTTWFPYHAISASFQYGGFESVSTGSTAWTNSMPGNVRNSAYILTNGGVLPSGTYDIYHWNHYGAGSSNEILGKTSTSFPSGTPVDTNLFYGKSGTSYPARSFVLDLSDSAVPILSVLTQGLQEFRSEPLQVNST